MQNLNRGLSGCSLKISNTGHLIKSSPSDIYNKRLEKQSKKQLFFADKYFKNIKTPKILNTYHHKNLFSIEMEYINAENEINFFNHASINQVDNTTETIINYLLEINHESYEYNFSEKISEKLCELEKNTKYKYIVNNLLNYIEKKNIILPYSFCHGDLTLANMLFQEETIYFIDFLDSYIDTFFCDIIKLKQDLYYYWNLTLNNALNARLEIIFERLWRKIFNEYKDYFKSPELQIIDMINFLRVEPYVITAQQENLIECILMKLYFKFNAKFNSSHGRTIL